MRLATLARELEDERYSDVIDLCVLVSRQYDIELTLDRGEKLDKLIQQRIAKAIAKAAKVAA